MCSHNGFQLLAQSSLQPLLAVVFVAVVAWVTATAGSGPVVAAATLALVLWAPSVLIQYVKLLLAAAFAEHFAALGGAADGTEQCSYDT